MEHSGVRFIVVTSGNNSLYEKVCAELKEEQIRLPVFRASTVGEAASLTKRMEKSVVITDSRELADVKEHLPSPERNTLFGGDPRLPEKGSCEEAALESGEEHFTRRGSPASGEGELRGRSGLHTVLYQDAHPEVIALNA